MTGRSHSEWLFITHTELLQALFEALKGGAAADLIELDLRGNPFTLDDLNQLVSPYGSSAVNGKKFCKF